MKAKSDKDKKTPAKNPGAASPKAAAKKKDEEEARVCNLGSNHALMVMSMPHTTNPHVFVQARIT
ncbi:MAG: hypothetical protein KGM98_03365 [Bacteroidota bacterium]|nr:hypothetical protein [Bacteroidota bacterium]